MGNAPFEWGPNEQATFDELKHLIASEEVTAQPRPIGKFRLEVDALGYALGGVLSQLQDNKWRSVVFISRTPRYYVCPKGMASIPPRRP